MIEPVVLIRSLQVEDIPGCVQVLLDNPLWQRYGVTPDGAQQMFASALQRRANLLVADVGGQAAGFVWFVLDGAWGRSGYIRVIGVSPRNQGQGIGERLMAAAENRVSEQSAEMFLLVSDFNLGAQRFYQRLGYQQVGAIPDYVIPGITELIFYKRLQSGQGL